MTMAPSCGSNMSLASHSTQSQDAANKGTSPIPIRSASYRTMPRNTTPL
jgi:hypothetical protein